MAYFLIMNPHFRGETFVTRKISKAVGRIAAGIQSKVTLGNLEASRDWDMQKIILKECGL